MSKQMYADLKAGQEPILTQLVRGYQTAGFIKSAIFPTISVPKRSGKIITFGTEHLERTDTSRAPGTDTSRVTSKASTESYAVAQHSMEAIVPREYSAENAGTPNFNVAQRKAKLAVQKVQLDLEYLAAEKAFDEANFAASNKSTPGTKIDNSADVPAMIDAADTVTFNGVLQETNVIAVNRNVFKALQRNTSVIDAIAESTKIDISTPYNVSAEIMSAALGKRIVVSKLAKPVSGSPFELVWGDHMGLYYVADGDEAAEDSLSFGYNYQLAGHPFVEDAYWDDRKKSWVYGYTDECEANIATPGAGYLYTNVLT